MLLNQEKILCSDNKMYGISFLNNGYLLFKFIIV